jgi:hypothetical protein
LDLRVKPRDPEASIRVALRDVQCPALQWSRQAGHGIRRLPLAHLLLMDEDLANLRFESLDALFNSRGDK